MEEVYEDLDDVRCQDFAKKGEKIRKIGGQEGVEDVSF